MFDGVSWKRLPGAVDVDADDAGVRVLFDAPLALVCAEGLRALASGVDVAFLTGTVTVRWRILLGFEANMLPEVEWMAINEKRG